mgnify:CR=1 FL=1
MTAFWMNVLWSMSSQLYWEKEQGNLSLYIMSPSSMMAILLGMAVGGIGGVGFTPIINAPEVAILGVAKSSMKPVYKDGGFVPRLILPFTLAYDHRVIDGAIGARFLQTLRRMLENPLMLIY